MLVKIVNKLITLLFKFKLINPMEIVIDKISLHELYMNYCGAIINLANIYSKDSFKCLLNKDGVSNPDAFMLTIHTSNGDISCPIPNELLPCVSTIPAVNQNMDSFFLRKNYNALISLAPISANTIIVKQPMPNTTNRYISKLSEIPHNIKQHTLFIMLKNDTFHNAGDMLRVLLSTSDYIIFLKDTTLKCYTRRTAEMTMTSLEFFIAEIKNQE